MHDDKQQDQGADREQRVPMPPEPEAPRACVPYE